MQQHAGDDAVGAPPVLDDLREIAGQGRDQLATRLRRRVELGDIGVAPQLVHQLARQLGEVVDEIQRVLDLMGDAGGQLAERGHLLGMD